MYELNDRVAIVTGGARGIGRAIAETLARNGSDVVVADIQAELAQATAQEIAENTGRKTLGIRVDVSDGASAKAMVDEAVETFGRVDILVNNAGITRDGLIMRMSESDWDLVLDVNLKGAFNCCKAVVRQMMKQRYGRIVNLSSVNGLVGAAGQTNYASSKAGLVGFTKSMAKEVGSRNITANAVAPGFIETVLTEDLSAEIRDMALKMTPVGRYGKPQDVANVVAFLVSEEAAFVTGEIIRVDGGMAM